MSYHEIKVFSVATASYKSALKMAVSLSPAEQLRLIQELEARVPRNPPSEPPRSILELCGLGKEIWEGIDAQEYVNRERASWNG
jgi:hypothetical protein